MLDLSDTGQLYLSYNPACGRPVNVSRRPSRLAFATMCVQHREEIFLQRIRSPRSIR